MIDLMPLARFMFDRQMDSYDADSALRELAWADPGVVDFWYEEASAIHSWYQGNI